MTARKPAAKAATSLPALKKGEAHIGLTLHQGKPHHLILLPGEVRLAWDKAVAWAKKKGGALPARIDMLVLFEHARDKFESTWYWTGQEYAGNADCAWLQHFYYGYQDSNRKSNGCRCRAVRRVPI